MGPPLRPRRRPGPHPPEILPPLPARPEHQRQRPHPHQLAPAKPFLAQDPQLVERSRAQPHDLVAALHRLLVRQLARPEPLLRRLLRNPQRFADLGPAQPRPPRRIHPALQGQPPFVRHQVRNGNRLDKPLGSPTRERRNPLGRPLLHQPRNPRPDRLLVLDQHTNLRQHLLDDSSMQC